MAGLSDTGLVGLSALVPAGIVSVDMLVSVSATVFVAEDVVARQHSDVRRQHRGGRQYHANAAHQRLPFYLFSADGLYDGFAHSSRGQVL